MQTVTIRCQCSECREIGGTERELGPDVSSVKIEPPRNWFELRCNEDRRLPWLPNDVLYFCSVDCLCKFTDRLRDATTAGNEAGR